MNTKIERTLTRVATPPPPAPGFIGNGHTAVDVLAGESLETRNPFVLLMDDRLDFGDDTRPLGDAHPHAGLETVTLVLEGVAHDRDEGDLTPGDAVWMTAGRGIIHGEFVQATGHVRVLQLWIRLPGRDRDVSPEFHVLHRDAVPTLRERGVTTRLYSGSFGELRSDTHNYAPVTIAEILLDPGARLVADVAAAQAGFLYGIAGTVRVGDMPVHEGDVGWLDAVHGADLNTLRLEAGEQGARLALYLGEPQREPFVTHGPFVAGSKAEIAEMYSSFRAGEFTRMSDLARAKHAATEGMAAGTS